jgi:hypothetical protein
MEDAKDERSPISGVAPPSWGKWKPGQSGNPRGRPSEKPFKEALARLRAERKRIDDEIVEVLASRALNGDMSAIKEWADRGDGKVPVAIGGTDDLPPIRGYSWIPPTLPSTE